MKKISYLEPTGEGSGLSTGSSEERGSVLQGALQQVPNLPDIPPNLYRATVEVLSFLEEAATSFAAEEK